MGQSILARGAVGPTAISEDRVFFTFRDGGFEYDCVECGARCCRGYGFAFRSAQQLQDVLRQRPALRFFVEPGDDKALVRNCPPSCFYLSSQQLCSLHSSSGREAKPDTCKLFPFNDFRVVENYLIVSPHPSLCPLRVVRSGEVSDCSRYHNILRDLTAAGISADVPRISGVAKGLDAVIHLERQVLALDVSSPLEDFSAHASRQLDLTRNASPVETQTGGDLTRFTETLCHVLQLDQLPEAFGRQGVAGLSVAVAPILRSHIIFGHGRFPAESSLGRIPHQLLILHMITSLAVEAGMEAVSYQTIMRLFSENRHLMHVLSLLNRPLAWKPNAPVDLGFGDVPADQRRFLVIAKGLLPAQQKRRNRTLGELLREVSDDSDPFESYRFLRCLATRLAGRVVDIEDRQSELGAKQSIRSKLDRFLLGTLDLERLRVIAERRTLAARQS